MDPQQSHRVLTMKARDDRRLVQYARLLCAVQRSVALHHGRRQFLPRRHAQSPHRRPRPPASLGSNLREATAQHSGTFSTRQCDGVHGLAAAGADIVVEDVGAAEFPLRGCNRDAGDLDARHSDSLRVVGGYDDMNAFDGERLRNAGPIPTLPAVMTAISSLNPRSMAFRSVESI